MRDRIKICKILAGGLGVGLALLVAGCATGRSNSEANGRSEFAALQAAVAAAGKRVVPSLALVKTDQDTKPPVQIIGGYRVIKQKI